MCPIPQLIQALKKSFSCHICCAQLCAYMCAIVTASCAVSKGSPGSLDPFRFCETYSTTHAWFVANSRRFLHSCQNLGRMAQEMQFGAVLALNGLQEHILELQRLGVSSRDSLAALDRRFPIHKGFIKS